MNKIAITFSIFIIFSCQSTPNYSNYSLYTRDIPQSLDSNVDPGTFLNCFHDNGGVDSYYFGENGDEEIILRVIDITNNNVSRDNRNIIQSIQKVKFTTDSMIGLVETETEIGLVENCPYNLYGRLWDQVIYERNTTINKKSLTFQISNKSIFVDQTVINNPVCRLRNTSYSQGYCKILRNVNPNYREFIEGYINPSKQL